MRRGLGFFPVVNLGCGLCEEAVAENFAEGGNVGGGEGGVEFVVEVEGDGGAGVEV